jgi:hypothetical protein
MTGWPRRTLRAWLTITLASLGAMAWTAPALAAAQPISACTTTSGVVVAVDFAHWGGPVLRSCGTTPTTAYDLVNQGGWSTTGTEHDGPGFICRIGYAGFQGGTQYPTAAHESCVSTPPSSAYWAFWYANPGQSGWSYSQRGATSTQPEPGSVELWTFGGTSLSGGSGSAVPTISPASLRAENAHPAPTATPTHPAPTRHTAASGPTARPKRPFHSASAHSPSAQPSPSATRRTPAVSNAPPAAATSPPGHSSPLPAIIALVIVLVLAAIGIVAMLRRPRRNV